MVESSASQRPKRRARAGRRHSSELLDHGQVTVACTGQATTRTVREVVPLPALRPSPRTRQSDRLVESSQPTPSLASAESSVDVNHLPGGVGTRLAQEKGNEPTDFGTVSESL